MSGQSELFALTLTGILPGHPGGEHLEFSGEVNGIQYYCKGDKNGRPLRATEWLATSLAAHLGIPVPDFAPIVNPENGEILFGSKGTWGTADRFEAEAFLTSQPSGDRAIGDPNGWLTSYLSRLYVYDLFVANPDRNLTNFLLLPGKDFRRLLAFDFASARLEELSSTNFFVAESQTLFVGRHLRKRRKFDLAAAIDRVPPRGVSWSA